MQEMVHEMHTRFRWCVGDKYDGGGMKGAKIYKAEEGRGEARGQRIGSRRINRYKIKA
jgi:hypothetical protein